MSDAASHNTSKQSGLEQKRGILAVGCVCGKALKTNAALAMWCGVVCEQKSKSKQWRVMASIKSRLCVCVCVCVSVDQSVVDARRDTHSTAFEHAMAPISHNNNKDTRSNIVNEVLLLL